jgi:hypothetical protein
MSQQIKIVPLSPNINAATTLENYSAMHQKGCRYVWLNAGLSNGNLLAQRKLDKMSEDKNYSGNLFGKFAKMCTIALYGCF